MELLGMADAESLSRKLNLIETNQIPSSSVGYLGYHLTVGKIPFLQGDLLPEELPYIRKMNDRRRQEFVAGRVAARLSLLRAAHEACPIPRAAAGAPVWPTGIVGSISHTSQMAAAIISSRSLTPSIGLDIEDNVPLPEELVDLIALREERIQNGTRSWGAERNFSKVIFSTKEAIFKADWPIHQTFLDFHDILLTPFQPGSLTGVVQADRRRVYLVDVVCSRESIVAIARPVDDVGKQLQ